MTPRKSPEKREAIAMAKMAARGTEEGGAGSIYITIIPG